ncbi:hypothetical protein DSECCO2_419600 [anaerobic digester metagenome]
MVAVISSEAEATVEMLVENSSMAEATEFMLELICSVAAATVVDLDVMSPEARRSCVASPSRPWEAWFSWFELPTTSRMMPWTCSTKVLNHSASSWVSVPEVSLRRAVRSPSPSAMSLSIPIMRFSGVMMERIRKMVRGRMRKAKPAPMKDRAMVREREAAASRSAATAAWASAMLSMYTPVPIHKSVPGIMME